MKQRRKLIQVPPTPTEPTNTQQWTQSDEKKSVMFAEHLGKVFKP